MVCPSLAQPTTTGVNRSLRAINSQRAWEEEGSVCHASFLIIKAGTGGCREIIWQGDPPEVTLQMQTTFSTSATWANFISVLNT